jgi:hypothetical protein
VRRLRTALCDGMGIDPPTVQAPAPRAVHRGFGCGTGRVRGRVLGMLALTGRTPERARRALRSVNPAHVVLPAARLIHDMAGQAATTGGRLHNLAV